MEEDTMEDVLAEIIADLLEANGKLGDISWQEAYEAMRYYFHLPDYQKTLQPKGDMRIYIRRIVSLYRSKLN